MKKKSGKIINVILILILILGLGLIAYPTFSDWWNSFHQTRAIAGYAEKVANMDHKDFDRMWEEAQAYNERLLEKSNRYALSEEEVAEYNSILDVTGTGIMGYIDIPKIDISLPIYHGVDQAVLQIAIGHIEGTSFPIGGIGSHAVVSGHRGLPAAKLFTDLDRLEKGDKFIVQVLDRTLTYEVDQIRIVLPEELQDLEIDPEKDYMTLVTCTPYGINSHRLLVRGHRVENDIPNAINVTADALQFKPYYVAPIVAAPILLILLITMLIMTSSRFRERRERSRKGAYDALETIIEEEEDDELIKERKRNKDTKKN